MGLDSDSGTSTDFAGRMAAAGRGITAHYDIHLWGEFGLRDQETRSDVTPRSRKARALLAYLACHPGHSATRERIAALLWSERGDPQARASLRQTLLEIRSLSHGPDALLDVEKREIRLRPGAAEIDADQLRRLAGTDILEPLSAELGRSGIDFLADLDDIDPGFDDWLRAERGRQHSHFLECAWQAAEDGLARGDVASVRHLLDHLLSVDPASELTVRLALRADHAAGDQASLQRHYRHLAHVLETEFGVAPTPETTALFEELSARPGAPTAIHVGPQPSPARQINTKAPASDGARRLRLFAGTAAIAALAFAAIWYLSRPDPITPPPPVIAVLPFTDMSTKAAPEFADGLSEEISSVLARRSQLKVLGRTSAEIFKDQSVDVRDIGRKLGVGYVLEGSVRSDGPKIRVDVTLVETESGVRLWSEQYDGRTGDIFAMQDKIGTAVADRLHSTFKPRKPLLPTAQRPTGESYQLYVTARSIMRQRNRAAMSEAVKLLTRATAITPRFAKGQAYLALAVYFGGKGNMSEEAVYELALRTAKDALASDPDSAEAHAVLGLLVRDPSQKRAHLERSVALDPQNAEAWLWLSNEYVATFDIRQAYQAVRRGYAIDPLWDRTVAAYISYSLIMGNVQDADAALNRLRSISQDSYTVNYVAAIYDRRRGRVADAYRHARAAIEAKPASSMLAQFELVQALYQLGEVEAAQHYATAFGQDRKFIYWDLAAATDNPESVARALREGVDIFQSETRAAIFAKHAIATGTGPDFLAKLSRRFGTFEKFWQGTHETSSDSKVSVALILRAQGRESEAAAMLGQAARQIATLRNGGVVDPEIDYFEASIRAVQGRREDALRLLDRAIGNGFRMQYPFLYRDIGREPSFAGLKGDPRFERVRRTLAEALAAERKQIGKIPPPEA